MVRFAKDTNVVLEFGDEQENSPSSNPDFAGKRPTSTLLRSNCSIRSRKLGRFFIPELTVQVMNEDQLPENRKEVDDQDPKLYYSEGWHHETDNQNFLNGTESWSS